MRVDRSTRAGHLAAHALGTNVAHYKFVATNDVYVHEGLIYVLHRFNGLDVVKYNKAK